MSPSHARKSSGQRYRYYVSQALLQGRPKEAGIIHRVSAGPIEALVEQAICKALPKPQQKQWVDFSLEQKRVRVGQLFDKITINRDCVEIKVADTSRELLGDSAVSGSLRVATVLKAGLGGRQIASRDMASPRVDRSLVKAIVWARDLRQRLEREGTSLDELAREEGCSRPYVSRMIRLAYLAPTITQAILDGTQPAELTLADLVRRDIPVDWADQRRSFGFL